MQFKTEKESLDYVRDYLLRHGYQRAEIQDRFCRWDITAVKDGIEYFFEVKRLLKRVARDGVYDDSICELSKIQSTPNLSRSYLVNLFTDCFSIIPYDSPHKILPTICQKYSWRKEDRVEKTLVSYYNHKKYLHQYE